MKNTIHPNFTIGGLVLVRRAHNKCHKLNNRALGPLRLAKVLSDHVYQASKLDRSETEIIHSARIILYCAADENTDVHPRMLEYSARVE